MRSILFVCAFLSSVSLAGESKGTGLLQLQIGQSRASEPVANYTDKAISYRLKIFGGMKLELPLVKAAGLGLDLTFHNYKLKEGLGGRYRKIDWDWFYLPISLGVFTITPGLGWTIVDVKIKSLDISEISVRPHAMINAGLTLPVAQHVAVALDARYSSVWSDKEQNINITGDHYAAFMGLVTYF